MGFESTSFMERKEFCGAARPSRSPSEKSSTVQLKPNRKVCEFVSHGQNLQNLPS
jgi:hypothetical protein